MNWSKTHTFGPTSRRTVLRLEYGATGRAGQSGHSASALMAADAETGAVVAAPASAPTPMAVARDSNDLRGKFERGGAGSGSGIPPIDGPQRPGIRLRGGRNRPRAWSWNAPAGRSAARSTAHLLSRTIATCSAGANKLTENMDKETHVHLAKRDTESSTLRCRAIAHNTRCDARKGSGARRASLARVSSAGLGDEDPKITHHLSTDRAVKTQPCNSDCPHRALAAAHLVDAGSPAHRVLF